MKILLLALCITAVNGYASVLSDVAAALTPGEWAEVTTNFPTATFFKDSTASGIFVYSDDAVWYSDSQWIMFTGSDHGGTVNPGAFVIYKAETDTWEKRERGLRGDFSHAYSFNTIDEEKDVYYHYDHSYPGGKVLAYDIHADVWSAYCTLDPNNTPTGMVEWFPEAGKMIAVGNNTARLRYLDTASMTWTGFGPNLHRGIAYHGLGRYNPKHKVILAGFGSTWHIDGDLPGYGAYIIDSNLTVTSTSVCSIFVAHPHGLLTCDPVSGDFLVMDRNGNFVSYDLLSDTWKKLPSPTVPVFDPADNSPIYVVSAPVPELGVAVFLQVRGTGAWGWASTSHVYLYKHDPAAGTVMASGIETRNAAPGTRLSFSPNPLHAGQPFFLKAGLESVRKLTLLNLQGRVVSGLHADKTGLVTAAGVGGPALSLPAGVYIIRTVLRDNKILTNKVIIIR
jgi:hypothetical protein